MTTAHRLRPDKGVTIQLPSNITIGDQQTLLLVGLGLIAGLVAGRVVGHSPGVVIQMIIGVLGDFLGRWLLSRARDPLGFDTGGGIISLVFAAFLGALVLMVVARAFGGGFRRGSSGGRGGVRSRRSPPSQALPDSDVRAGLVPARDSRPPAQLRWP